MNLALLAVFTLFMSVSVGAACTAYAPLIVLEAVVLTAAIVGALTAYRRPPPPPLTRPPSGSPCPSTRMQGTSQQDLWPILPRRILPQNQLVINFCNNFTFDTIHTIVSK